MSAEFDKIRQDLTDFKARIKTWKFDDLSDEESDLIADMIDDTLALLTGESDEDFDDEEDEDFDE